MHERGESALSSFSLDEREENPFDGEDSSIAATQQWVFKVFTREYLFELDLGEIQITEKTLPKLISENSIQKLSE